MGLPDPLDKGWGSQATIGRIWPMVASERREYDLAPGNQRKAAWPRWPPPATTAICSPSRLGPVPALRPVRLRLSTGTFFVTPLGPNRQPRQLGGNARPSHVEHQLRSVSWVVARSMRHMQGRPGLRGARAVPAVGCWAGRLLRLGGGGPVDKGLRLVPVVVADDLAERAAVHIAGLEVDAAIAARHARLVGRIGQRLP